MTETSTASQASRHFDRTVLGRFRSRFRGDVITAEDETYAEARLVWNGMIDRFPVLIARCVDSGDVAAAVALARELATPLAVRGGGHSAAGFGTCDGGIVIDLSLLRAVDVDPATRRAAAGGGATWAELDRATQAHGLAVTGGLVTHTGIGGLTLGGGIGNLMRRCGLTADGAVVQVSEEENPDLLWGLRGGGGNFGVVTRFEYRLHQVGPTVLAGAVMYPLRDAREVLRFYRDWAPTLPEAMTTFVALRGAPAAPFVPHEMHGKPIVAVATCWSGDLDEGESVIEPLRRFQRPLIDVIASKSYLEHQSMLDPTAPRGRQNYKRNRNLADISDEAIDVLIEHTQRKESPLSMTLLFQFGGAVSQVLEDATAYSDRGAMYNADLNAQWVEPRDPQADEHMRWVRDLYTALEPFTTGGAYVNFLMGDEGHDRVRATYGSTKHARLVALKHRYDPDNVFQINHNIDPGSVR